MKTKLSLLAICCIFALFGCGKDTTTTPNNSNNNTTGSICFWSDATAANAGGISVYVDGNYAGYYGVYSPSSTAPSCGASGYLTVSLSPGAHYFTAKSGSGNSWNSTSFNITSGQCTTMDLYL